VHISGVSVRGYDASGIEAKQQDPAAVTTEKSQRFERFARSEGDPRNSV
jgi:hypothetical protein